MSRTKTHIKSGRNDRYHADIFEYSPEYVEAYKKRFQHEPPTGWDDSWTTDAFGVVFHPSRHRHPNKKKHRSLKREFGITKCCCTIDRFRNPYGSVEDRSFRLKGFRKVGTRLRRARLKKIVNHEIDIQMS